METLNNFHTEFDYLNDVYTKFNCIQPLTSYSEILVANCNFFPTPLHLTLRCSHWNSGKTFGPQKTRIMGLPGSKLSEDSFTIG